MWTSQVYGHHDKTMNGNWKTGLKLCYYQINIIYIGTFKLDDDAPLNLLSSFDESLTVKYVFDLLSLAHVGILLLCSLKKKCLHLSVLFMVLFLVCYVI